MTEAPPRTVAFRVVFPFAFGYFISYLTRVVNAVIAPELVDELGLDAADLGFLTSSYFLVFASFQLPLGILLDRFGPRRINAALLLVAALGAFVFSVAGGMTGLTIGRGLIGLGVSACLMSPFTAYRIWFPKGRLPLVNGIQMAAGGLGAIMGTVPVEAALAVVGWRGVFVAFAAIAVAAAVTVFAVVPRRGVRDANQPLRSQLRGFAAIFCSPLFLRIAPVTIAAQGTFVGVQSLWVGPWLADVAGFDRVRIASVLFLIAVTMVIGFLTWGGVAERLGRRGVRPISVALVGMTVFQASQACAIVFPTPEWALPVWLAFGFFGTSNVLCYAMLAQCFPAEMAGRVNTGLNMLVFGGAFAIQWGIGVIINRWPPMPDGGYPIPAYQTALAVVLVLQILATGWYALYRRNEIRT